MKRFFAFASALLLATSLVVGCSEQTGTETTTETTGPGGTTETTVEKTTETTGDNPPPADPVAPVNP